MKAGELLILSHGEYSDYSYSGPFRVLKDFDPKEQADECREYWRQLPESERCWQEGPDSSNYIAFLHARGFIEDVDCTEIHVGSYGRLQIDGTA